MGLIYFPATYAHNNFAFNQHLPADGTENTAYLDATVILEQLLENAGYRDLRDPLHLAVGGTFGRVHKGLKVWDATGSIIVPEASNLDRYAAMDDRVRALRAAFDPYLCLRDAPAAEGAFQLAFSEATADTANYPAKRIPMQIYARPIGQPYVAEALGERGERKYRITLIAADPRTYSQAEQTLALSAGTPSGSMNNAGNHPSPLKVTVTMDGAGSASFTISRASVAFVVDLSGFALNDVLTIVMEQSAIYGRGRYITKNGTENARLKTSAASTWLDAPVGASTVTISNTTNVRSCVLNWYHAWS